MVTLYTIGCARCNILKQKLDEHNVVYEINENREEMLSLGIQNLPVLLADGIMMDFSDAIKWVRNLG